MDAFMAELRALSSDVSMRRVSLRHAHHKDILAPIETQLDGSWERWLRARWALAHRHGLAKPLGEGA